MQLFLRLREPQRRGQMIGAYYLIRDLIVSTGAIIGAFLWKLGPAINFLTAALLSFVGTVLYIINWGMRRSFARASEVNP
jgi:hypothetical protein